MPESGAKWFSQYLNNDQNVDVWLSMRLNHLNQSEQFKYIAEFRAIDASLFEKESSRNFDVHGVKLQVLIEDLNKENVAVFKKIRRHAENHYTDSKVAGQYVSHKRVVIIGLKNSPNNFSNIF